jgi:hypothetical protein
MPIWNPYAMVNPYAAAFAAPPLPPAIKIETGPGNTAFQFHLKGLRSELSQDVIINRGEIETDTVMGQVYHFKVPTQDDSGHSYYEEVSAVETTQGEQGFVPVNDEPEAPYQQELVYEQPPISQGEIIYEDLSQYFYQQPVPETAPYYDPFASQGYYYTTPDNAPPYVPPPSPDWQDSGTTEEQQQVDQQAIDQAAADWLEYTIALEQIESGYFDYYYDSGTGPIV